MVVLVSGDDISLELCEELRKRFLAEVKESPDLYEEADVEKLQSDDEYCRKFIRHKKGNVDNAFEMLKEALAWRKSFDVKNIRTETIPAEFFTAKAVFPYNCDKDGNPLIMLLVRYHRKDPEIATDLRRFLVYWVELMEAQTTTGKMSVIMNCVDSGLSHLDLDLIKFLITLFRSYYPDSLAFILIYEMPWIFNAAWKIIKSWLPEDTVDKIKFINKSTVLQYVNKESLPLEMGGTDPHEYEPSHLESDVNSNSLQDSTSEAKRRVHFAENGSTTDELQNGPLVPSGALQGSSSQDDTSQIFLTDDFCIIGSILKISPASTLSFICPSAELDATSVKINLTCMSKKCVAYKVKTNNIDGYRVRPSTGIIESGKSAEIVVHVVQGYRPNQNDKFLIMAMELSDSSVTMSNLSLLWRTAAPGAVVDHKLKCAMQHQPTDRRDSRMESAIQNINTLLVKLNNKVQNLETKQRSIQTKQNISIFLLFLIVAMFCALLINTYSNILLSLIS